MYIEREFIQFFVKAIIMGRNFLVILNCIFISVYKLVKLVFPFFVINNVSTEKINDFLKKKEYLPISRLLIRF